MKEFLWTFGRSMSILLTESCKVQEGRIQVLGSIFLWKRVLRLKFFSDFSKLIKRTNVRKRIQHSPPTILPLRYILVSQRNFLPNVLLIYLYIYIFCSKSKRFSFIQYVISPFLFDHRRKQGVKLSHLQEWFITDFLIRICVTSSVFLLISSIRRLTFIYLFIYKLLSF